MEHSENYKFALPTAEDDTLADIGVISENFKTVDRVMKQNSDLGVELNKFEAETLDAVGRLSAKDADLQSQIDNLGGVDLSELQSQIDTKIEQVNGRTGKSIAITANDIASVGSNTNLAMDVSLLGGEVDKINAHLGEQTSSKTIHELIDTKVTKVDGKGLSTNDYDDTAKEKVTKIGNTNLIPSDSRYIVQWIQDVYDSVFKSSADNICLADRVTDEVASRKSADENLQSQIDALGGVDVSELQTDINHLQEKVNVMYGDIGDWIGSDTVYQAVTKLKAKDTDLQSQIDNLGGVDVSELETDIETLKTNVSNLQSADATAMDSIGRLMTADENLQSQIDTLESDIVDLQAQTLQQTPLFADSIEECTDTSSLYVLPDGYIYAYMSEETIIPGEPLYTNLANPTSAEWAVSSRFSSGGAVSAVSGMNADISNYIPIEKDYTVRVKGMNITDSLPNGSNCRCALYTDNKTFLSVIDSSAAHESYVTVDNDGVSTIVINDALLSALAITLDPKFFRVGGTLNNTKEDVIITVNEEIKETDPTIVKEYKWTNTGYAFIPADYEDRIVDLENEAKELKFRIIDIEENGLTGDIIPEYWKSAVSTAIEKIKAKQNLAGHDCVNFIMFSDMHIIHGQNNHAHNIGKLSRHLMDECDIPLTCFLGDWVNSAGESTKELTLDDVRVAKEILSPISKEELCTITGNHDLWFDGNTHAVSMEERYNAVCRHNTKDFHKVFGKDGNYYYVDNVPQKTRFIFLDGNWAEWTVDSNNTPSYNSFAQGGYGQDQLQFLADSLKVQSGWNVYIFTHVPPIAEYRPPTTAYDYFRDGDVLIGIINAYADKATYSGSHNGSDYNGFIHDWAKVNISVDYTAETGNLVAMFTGHRHLDEVFTDVLKCPIVVVTTCGGQKLKDGYSRTFATDTETSLDVVTINKATRKIYCTRVGAGTDREISY